MQDLNCLRGSISLQNMKCLQCDQVSSDVSQLTHSQYTTIFQLTVLRVLTKHVRVQQEPCC